MAMERQWPALPAPTPESLARWAAEITRLLQKGEIANAATLEVPGITGTGIVARIATATYAARTITAGGGIRITNGDGVAGNPTIFSSITRRNVADITSGDTVIASDNAKEILIFGGTGTLAFTAAATLGDGFWFIVRNAGTGNVTLDPNSTEQIDDLTSWVLYPGGVALITCNASNFRSILISPMRVTFNSSGTFTRPGVGTVVEVECWGAGGSGGRGATDLAGGGGGGGAYATGKFAFSAVGTTETVTIGTGGAARTTNVAGADGGNTTFGSLLTGYGGGGGLVTAAGRGGGGGGATSAGVGATPGNPSIIDQNLVFDLQNSGLGGARSYTVGGTEGSAAAYGGASGGNGDAATGGLGGPSYMGGGGGGGGGDTVAGGAGGTSVFGGAGGAGATGAANAAAGTQPSGGGGGSETGNSGAGANGRVRVTVF